MKVLYILKKEPKDSVKNMLKSHKKMADVTVIDLKNNKNYTEIIDKVFDSDKVISV